MKSAWMMAALFLAGCQHAPPQALQPGDAPPAWSLATAQGAAWPTRDWWKGFGSTELSNLLYEAEANSFDTQTAAQRVIEAEAQVTLVGANLWPSLDVSGSSSRRGDFQSGTGDAVSYNASLGLGYEVDLWGQNRANRRSAVASLAASRFDQTAVGLATASGVASAYVEILSLRDRIKNARLDLDSAQEILRLIEARVNNGAAPPSDLVQQRAAVARQQAAIPPLLQQERETLSALAILIGRPAHGFNVETQSLQAVAIPVVSPGLPSQLLQRRPDVAEAEAQLAAASANLDAARTAFFPSINLSGSAGGASTALQALFDPGATAWSIAVSASETIFDAGRRGAQVKASKAREQELVLAYRKAVLSAFSEVDLTMNLIQSLAQQRALVEIQLASAREAYRLAQVRYREGATDLTEVLQTQSSLFSAEDQLTQVKLQQAQAAVTLYRALGGGWDRTTSGI